MAAAESRRISRRSISRRRRNRDSCGRRTNLVVWWVADRPPRWPTDFLSSKALAIEELCVEIGGESHRSWHGAECAWKSSQLGFGPAEIAPNDIGSVSPCGDHCLVDPLAQAPCSGSLSRLRLSDGNIAGVHRVRSLPPESASAHACDLTVFNRVGVMVHQAADGIRSPMTWRLTTRIRAPLPPAAQGR